MASDIIVKGSTTATMIRRHLLRQRKIERHSATDSSVTMGWKGLSNSGILDLLENSDIGRPEKSMVFNREKKDLSGNLTERVATWWLIVAASGVTLRAELDFGGFFLVTASLAFFFFGDGQSCTLPLCSLAAVTLCENRTTLFAALTIGVHGHSVFADLHKECHQHQNLLL